MLLLLLPFLSFFSIFSNLLIEHIRYRNNTVQPYINMYSTNGEQHSIFFLSFSSSSHSLFFDIFKGKPDLNTSLPVRQTASIFKQPVTKVTNHPTNKVKTDPQKAVDQPRQVNTY